MAKTILIIDDEVDFAATLRMRLEAGGYRIICAYEGKAGLEAAKKDSPDVVLLDLVMAEMNGFTVLAELKKDPYTAAIPVIIITAKTDREYARDAENLGADAYLSKPVKIADLEATLKKFIVP
ncbi:MAG: response regulator [Candidatus Omnitrophota bacterium]